MQNLRTEIIQIYDRANWVIGCLSKYITTCLRKEGVFAKRTSAYRGFKDKILHFQNRYAFLQGGHREADKNKLILSWFHGDQQSGFRGLDEACCRLLETYKSAAKIMTSCEKAKRGLVGMGIHRGMVEVIPFGVDLCWFVPQSFSGKQFSRDRLEIPWDALCIGSFQKDGDGWEEGLRPKMIKGPDVFLNVISKLSKKYSNLHVLLTGPARGYMGLGLKKMGIPYTHRYFKNYLEIVTCYHALDLYMIPARCEGGPFSMLESWATGIPLVSTDVGMPADHMVHGKNGLLAEVEDVDALTENCVRFIEDKQLVQTCTENGLKKAKEFSWETITKQYIERLYSSNEL